MRGMNRARRIVWLPLLVLAPLLLAACDDEAAPERNGFDILPQWQEGRSYTYREERWSRGGGGPFPPEGEILARTQFATQEIHVYRVDVIEALGSQLLRARFTYLTSVQGRPDALAPDVLAGKSFLVMEPFGAMRIEKATESGAEPPSVEEAAAVRATALRMAGSLLPTESKEVGATWPPGRDLDFFAREGKGPIRMTTTLDRIERRDGREFAVVKCDTDASVAEGERRGARISMQETLWIDLAAHRFESYHSSADFSQPGAPRRREEWRRKTVDLTRVEE